MEGLSLGGAFKYIIINFVYRVHGTQIAQLELAVFNGKIGFEKYSPGLEILAKTSKKMQV